MPELFQNLYRFREFAPGETQFVKGRTPLHVAQALYCARRKFPELRKAKFSSRSTQSGVVILREQ